MGRIFKKQPAVASGPEKKSDIFEFLPDDFTLRGDADVTHIDRNFASLNYWTEVRQRFFSNKGAVFSLALVILIALFAAFGPMMSGYSYSNQNLAEKNFAPRIPGLENIGIFDGDEALQTTTGTKMINGYKDKNLTDVFYWFGSDVLGRDIWTRVWEGNRPGDRKEKFRIYRR